MAHSGNDIWLTTETFASLAAISIQAARRALKGAASGKPWRGVQLAVRPHMSAGGHPHCVWEVEMESLPLDLRCTADATRPLSIPLSVNSSADADVLEARWRVIQGALALPPRSPER